MYMHVYICVQVLCVLSESTYLFIYRDTCMHEYIYVHIFLFYLNMHTYIDRSICIRLLLLLQAGLFWFLCIAWHVNKYTHN